MQGYAISPAREDQGAVVHVPTPLLVEDRFGTV